MPHLWLHNKVAVELEELVPDFWKSLNALNIELWRYKDKPYGIKRLQKGGNGRKMLVDFDTLGRDIQDILGDPRKCNHPLERFYKVEQEAVEYYADYVRPGIGNLKMKEQEQYVVNATVLQAIIRLEPVRIVERRNKKGTLKGLANTLSGDATTFNEILKVKHGVTHNLPSNHRRFMDALKAFRNNGYYSVIKDPEGKGRRNAKKMNDEVLEVIKGLFVEDYKPTATDIARAYESFLDGYAEVYNENTGELYDPKEFPKLSKSTITSYLAMWEHKIGTYKQRSGNRQVYMANFHPYAQTELPKYAGSLISIDDRQPPFWYDKQKRMWFYIGMDIASGCITTFVYGKTKEGIILDFYRQMVRNHAEWGLCLPDGLECESSLNSSFTDSFLREGYMFNNVRIEANNAQGKIIERRFGSIRYEVEKKAPGWIARPHARKEANQVRPGKVQIIPYDELVGQRLAEIEDWNNSPHHEDKSMSRWEYFLNNQHPDLKPINYKAILPSLGYCTKTSCSRGYIGLQGRKRAIAEDGKILTGDALIEKMKMIEGKDIEVRWLDNNDGTVLKAYAFLDDRLICEVMEMPRFNRAVIDQTDEDKEIMELQMHYKNTVIAYANEQQKELQPVKINDLTPKPERKFKISSVQRYQAREDFDEIEIVDDLHEDDQEMYNPDATPVKGWRSSF